MPALNIFFLLRAQLVELADTLGLEPSAARHGGSTPSLGTILVHIHFALDVRDRDALVTFLNI